MNNNPSNEELWNQKATDWNIQTGEEGDFNRKFNSDPFIWKFLGQNINGSCILDAGCGTGYFSRLLSQKGAIVTGIDFSSNMIEKAKELTQLDKFNIEFLVDSCTTLRTQKSIKFDWIISNYVLMDLEKIDLVSNAFYRVLKPGGKVIVVINHPCFPQSKFTEVRKDGSIHYKWDFSYFEKNKVTVEPWKHFTTPFIYFQRPLSKYWKSFKKVDFKVIDFDEPVVQNPPPSNYDLEQFNSNRMRPNSVIFLLKK